MVIFVRIVIFSSLLYNSRCVWEEREKKLVCDCASGVIGKSEFSCVKKNLFVQP